MFYVGTLETELADILSALFQVVGGEVLAGGSHHFAVYLHLGLQEGRLVQQIVVVIIVSGHFQCHDVCAELQKRFDVVTVDAVEIVCRHTGTMCHKLAVYLEPVVARGGQFDIGG